MRVLIVNTSELRGGAAVAARRLMNALTESGVKAKMLVADKQTEHISVCPLPRRWLHRWHFLYERWRIFCHLHFSRRHLFDIDTGAEGYDITRLPEFQEADVIHLSWVNQGMLSLRVIERIVQSGKAVVWTMHDIWPATALCHLTLDCERFLDTCHHCPCLPGGGGARDLAARVWQQKQRVWGGGEIVFVACSQWLAGRAAESGLLRHSRVVSIPNPIDTRLFCPGDRSEARRRLGLPTEGRLILFAAQRVTNAYKGIGYLQEAIERLVATHPEMRQDTALLVLGGDAGACAGSFSLTAHALPYTSSQERIIDIYRAADLFVLPSLSENLPNTIMEAMACGVPCVAFRVGGIPEEIDHRANGYVAEYRSADDLARGIRWTLDEADHDALSEAARHKVIRAYSMGSVARRYQDLYQEVLTQRHRTRYANSLKLEARQPITL